MAMRRFRPETPISIWDRQVGTLRELMERGLADSVATDPGEAVREAGLVVLCTPVEAMEELAAAFVSNLSPGSVVTDAGSVKSCVTQRLGPLLGGRFVGGHPMAGSERSGLASARADLFEGAPCLLTPVVETDRAALAGVADFWSSLGARVATISPAEHDRLVARLSHLPHALAFALVHLAATTLPEGSVGLAGGSFRDATRVASSNPGLWTGILTENRDEVAGALREMSALLLTMADDLDAGKRDSLLDFLERAREHRDSLPLPPPEETL